MKEKSDLASSSRLLLSGLVDAFDGAGAGAPVYQGTAVEKSLRPCFDSRTKSLAACEMMDRLDEVEALDLVEVVELEDSMRKVSGRIVLFMLEMEGMLIVDVVWVVGA